MSPMPTPRRVPRAARRIAPRSAMRGLSLVELMISMVLGLLVVGSAVAIFISNRQTYRATEGVGRVQENGRMAFELMARDLREAGGNACGNSERGEPLKLVNVLNTPATQWWTNWNNGAVGYEGAIPVGSPANRVAGTDAIDLMSGDMSSSATVSAHDVANANITLNTVDHGLTASDVVIVCDYRQASMFQISAVAGAVIRHANGAGTPGNCSRGLGYGNPALCTPAGRPYQYGPNPADTLASATVVRMHPVRWYVGTVAGGGRSLFRRTVINTTGTLAVRDQEIAQGVNDMQLQYLLPGGAGYVDASAVPAARWSEVTAVRIVLDVFSADRAGVGAGLAGAQLQRRIAHTVTLRNRMQ